MELDNEVATAVDYPIKLIVGLCGKARSGKDTVAKYLAERFDFMHASFASKLKDVTQDLFDMTDEQLNGKLKEVVDGRYGKTPRWLLQHLGTNVFRELYPTMWSDYLFRHLPPWEPKIVISDVRFPNEIDAIRSRNGHVWKIVRVGHEGASGGIDGHASETSLDSLPGSDYDAVLSAGDGDLSLLYRQADKAVQKAFGKEGVS